MKDSASGVVVIGAGGHAKVVISTLREAGLQVAFAVDDDPVKHGSQINGVPVRSPGNFPTDGRAIIAIGDNRKRFEVAQKYRDIEWVSVVHPRAWVHASVRLGPGTAVFAGAVIQPDAVIGAHGIINTGVTVDHDCVLGECVHLGPGTHIAGSVRIGRGALLGVGCSVIPSVSVGTWVTVGAGSVVVSDLPDDVTVVGAPARPVSARKP